ncbi:MAG: hypothetical protein AAF748_06870 [Pseudomonadota bacterium]
MHISETSSAPTGTHGSAPRGADYSDALARFANDHVSGQGWAAVVEAYHAVRAMPYFSGPDRTPLAALRSGRGACTARHIILRDLLRRLGVQADVEIVDCDFAAAVPPHPTMPADLRHVAEEGSIRDMHCWVRAWNGETPVLLDATWPDTLAAYGFAVNAGWAGAGDTRAAADGTVRCAPEDVLASKEALLSELSDKQSNARLSFLAGLSKWLNELPSGQEGGRR